MSKIERFTPQTGRVRKEDDSIMNVADKLGEMLGQAGSKRITTADATIPAVGYVFVAIQVTEDAVIAALVGNMSNATNITLPAGHTLYGRFTSITLTSGKVVAYQGV